MKIKKIIYVILTTSLGLMLAAIVHAGIEILYIRNAIHNSVVLVGHPLFGHYCAWPIWLQITIWLAGIMGGFLLGFYWWRIVYIEKRRFGAHVKRKFMQYRGFTLIELLVVVAIIGLLASVVLASLNGARARARDVKRIADIKAVITALDLFYDDHGRYPDANDGVSLVGECIGDACGNSNTLEAALEPYLPEVPRDPLHNCTANPLPPAGSVCANSYFYGYDFSHDGSIEGTCTADPLVDGNSLSGATVVSINRLEKLESSRDTCSGGDMHINTADFNVILCKNLDSSNCFQNLF